MSVWRWRWEKAQGHLQLLECLRGHTDQATCVVASRAFSIIVSGSDDKSAIIWDLNRHRFVHLLGGHESRVQHVAIVCYSTRLGASPLLGARPLTPNPSPDPQSSTTGDVATCSGAVLRLWTVNGVLLATQATSNLTDPITAVAFSNVRFWPLDSLSAHADGLLPPRPCCSPRRHRSSPRDTEQVGSCSGVVNGQTRPRVSSPDLARAPTESLTHPPEQAGWQLSLIHTLKHHSRFPSSSSLGEAEATISALAFTARTLYSGDSDGRVWLWNPPGTELFLSDGVAPACMGCGSKFGLMECESSRRARGSALSC